MKRNTLVTVEGEEQVVYSSFHLVHFQKTLESLLLMTVHTARMAPRSMCARVAAVGVRT